MKVEGNRKEGGQSIVPTSGLTFGLRRTNKLDLSVQLYLHIVERLIYRSFPTICTANDLE